MKSFCKRSENASASAGYTLIEILVALAIFSIGIMAMGALQGASLMSTGKTTRNTIAWALLEDQVESLKALPFYANDDNIDNDGDGDIDELTEEMPDLVEANNYSRTTLDGLYTVFWQVENDNPIAQQTQATLPGVPTGSYTVCKTISVQVARFGENPVTDALARVEFIKTWAEQGIPQQAWKCDEDGGGCDIAA